MIRIIDTFKDYKEAYKHQPETLDDIKTTWVTYISVYPEIQAKMIRDYEENDIDWLDYAYKNVFNKQTKEYPKMLQAYEHLTSITDKIIKRAEFLYGLEFDISIIYYVGLHNSAGWVDYYENKMAIYIGIDKIAELEWHNKEALETLISHELCHALHYTIRGIPIGESGFKSQFEMGIWDLYEEGFAKHYESSLVDHMNASRGDAWYEACLDKKDRLKELYLKALSDQDIGTRDFYGDWYKVEGLSDVGYFLGEQFISLLSKTLTYKEIAMLNHQEIINKVESFLKA